VHNDASAEWHALRAYQDEQRKKGEPIIMTDNEALQFSRLCLRSETQFNYVHAYTGQPGIQSITPLKPYGQRVNGRFTNFRWRPGHGPKRVSSTNDSRDGNPVPKTSVSMHDLISRLENNRPKEKAKVIDYLSVVYPPFEIPKGGSNG
jgi:murein tripeptide amidase MpaA